MLRRYRRPPGHAGATEGAALGLTLGDVASVIRSRRAERGILRRVSERVREVLGEVDHRCRSCSGCVVAVETRSRKRFRDRFRADPDRRVMRYEYCLDCGSTVVTRAVDPRRIGGNMPPPGDITL